MQECRYFKIHGTVQGVFYRANTEKVAQSLGLTGWVRNTQDNCVECQACGEASKLNKFEQWLNQGPDMAEVTHVDSQKIDYVSFKSFDIRY